MTITINYVVKLNKQHKLEYAYVCHFRVSPMPRSDVHSVAIEHSVWPLEQNKLLYIGQVWLFVPCVGTEVPSLAEHWMHVRIYDYQQWIQWTTRILPTPWLKAPLAARIPLTESFNAQSGQREPIICLVGTWIAFALVVAAGAGPCSPWFMR